MQQAQNNTLVLKLAEPEHIASDIRKEFYARPTAQITITPEEKTIINALYKETKELQELSDFIMKAQASR
jgi:hypothetical protein